MKVLLQAHDLSDNYLRFAAQIGADGFDIGPGASATLPGVAEQGYVDRRRFVAIVDRVRGRGLTIQRVAPPRPVRYLLGEPGGERDVDDLCRTVEALGKVGIPLVSMPLDDLPIPAELGGYPPYRGYASRTHRGGYTMVGYDLATLRARLASDPPRLAIDPEEHFDRCVRLYERVLPLADAYDMRFVVHPSDPPLADAVLSPDRWLRLLDAVPSERVGLLYCVGTRHEAGVDVVADIGRLGRRGKIFHVHFRNVRGTLVASGGYAEVALDDGDLNLARVLAALRAVGYDESLQVDHLPTYDGDTAFQGMAGARAVGYIRGLIAASEALG